MILTSRPGQFRNEGGEGLVPVESWDYRLCGRTRARFVIARIDRPSRVRIVDETPPHVVNLVPTKFLERFDSLALARGELESLARGGGSECALVPSAAEA